MGILDGVHLKIGLTHSFVYYSGCDVIPTVGTSWWYVINYSDLYSFVANGLCNYCLELWLTLNVYSMELLWLFLMLALDMIFVDWIVKKEKSTGTLRCLSHASDPLGFRVWQRWCKN